MQEQGKIARRVGTGSPTLFALALFLTRKLLWHSNFSKISDLRGQILAFITSYDRSRISPLSELIRGSSHLKSQ